ncbi:unnamed protein product [Rangifer tarandus platyrhynchus]|uniref:Uncharacterized protein n=1 Tax=Rangifer tarandus platyrhynchus TaxID=3082113 RepID=A0ACB1KG07_RANTA
MRWKDAVLHRAVGMPSWQDKHGKMAMKRWVYGVVCNLADPAPARNSVLKDPAGMSWKKEDLLRRQMSVRSKTTVLLLHIRPSVLSTYIAFQTRPKLNIRMLSVMFCCFKRSGPCIEGGPSQDSCESVYA